MGEGRRLQHFAIKRISVTSSPNTPNSPPTWGPKTCSSCAQMSEKTLHLAGVPPLLSTPSLLQPIPYTYNRLISHMLPSLQAVARPYYLSWPVQLNLSTIRSYPPSPLISYGTQFMHIDNLRRLTAHLLNLKGNPSPSPSPPTRSLARTF